MTLHVWGKLPTPQQIDHRSQSVGPGFIINSWLPTADHIILVVRRYQLLGLIHWNAKKNTALLVLPACGTGMWKLRLLSFLIRNKSGDSSSAAPKWRTALTSIMSLIECHKIGKCSKHHILDPLFTHFGTNHWWHHLDEHCHHGFLKLLHFPLLLQCSLPAP